MGLRGHRWGRLIEDAGSRRQQGRHKALSIVPLLSSQGRLLGLRAAPWGRGSVREGFAERQKQPRTRSPGCGICSQANATASQGLLQLPAKEKLAKDTAAPGEPGSEPPRCIEKRFSSLLHRFKCAAGRAPPMGRGPRNFTNQTRRSGPRPSVGSSSQHVSILHAEAAPATAGLGGLRGHG